MRSILGQGFGEPLISKILTPVSGLEDIKGFSTPSFFKLHFKFQHIWVFLNTRVLNLIKMTH